MTPAKMADVGGKKCRDAVIANRHKTLKSEGAFTYCLGKDGNWALAKK